MLTLKYYISKKKGKVYCSTLDIEDDNSFQPYMETNIPVDLVKELYSLASKDEELAFNAERKLLKSVNLFDIYEGDKLEAGKKSYAVSFMLQDEEATLNDKQIDNVMQKLIKTYTEKLGATLR